MKSETINKEYLMQRIPSIAETPENWSFSKAFLECRGAGFKTFRWQGNLYHTRQADDPNNKQGD